MLSRSMGAPGQAAGRPGGQLAEPDGVGKWLQLAVRGAMTMLTQQTALCPGRAHNWRKLARRRLLADNHGSG